MSAKEEGMYKVTRKDGKIIVTDSNNQVIYAAEADSIIVYKKSESGNVFAEKIGGLADEGLLIALANAVSIKPI
jgi:hypothetical protein